MIFSAKPGEVVGFHYRLSMRPLAPYHGKVGRIAAVSRGKGPRNTAVKISQEIVICPRGNLVRWHTRWKTGSHNETPLPSEYPASDSPFRRNGAGRGENPSRSFATEAAEALGLELRPRDQK
jgi:hypothetical protein